MPNGCRVIGPVHAFRDLKAVALTTQPSRRKRAGHCLLLKPFQTVSLDRLGGKVVERAHPLDR